MPRPSSARDRNVDFSALNDTGEYRKIVDGGDGLGSLADELAEAWDEDDEEDINVLYSNGPILDEQNPPTAPFGGVHHGQSIAVPASSAMGSGSSTSLSPPEISYRSKHRRQNSQYDGSDYGEDSDLENANGISLSLESRMAAVESLARRGTEANGSRADNVTQRVADLLKDLPSQSGVENGTSRYINSLQIDMPYHRRNEANGFLDSSLLTQL